MKHVSWITTEEYFKSSLEEGDYSVLLYSSHVDRPSRDFLKVRDWDIRRPDIIKHEI